MYWNSNSHDKILDPSQPLSEKTASEEDRIESEHLYQTFLKDKYLSDISDPNHPAKIAFTNAINSLNNLLNTWIRGLGVQQGGDQNLIVRLVPYGSHRLEVSTIDGDVDALVLAPKFVERDKHFFGEFPSILKEDPNVTDVQTIKEAFVPLIKLKYQGLSIDLIFASLDTSSLDDKLEKLKDDSILMNMDAEMKRSVNGFRVAEKILESVKDLKTFRTTLKLVKLWAKSKSIYSNSIGYLGGISCAILVARICQMFPNFTPNKLLVNFFKFYSEWKWDVYQVHIAKTEWASEEGSAMVVVTPSYPSMNSTYNVSNTTLKVITGHLQESYNIILRNPKEVDWKKIFDKYDFFKSYYHFFEITIGSDAETREPYIRWRSLVESKLRYFTKGFEFFDYHKQFDIRPYPIPFEQDNDSFKYEVSYYIGFKPNKDHMNISCKINFMPIAKEFFDNLALFKKKEDKIKILYKPREELPEIVFENKERPKWATKDWIESRRQISSEKSENEEVNSQSGQKNIPNFLNMPRQQNNFQFYPYSYGSQYMPNNANAQNNNFGPINYMYPPPQYNNFQGQNQVIFQGNNNANLGQNPGNRKQGGEGQGNPGEVGINGGNDNGNSDSISNS